jgi:hypothetical protein
MSNTYYLIVTEVFLKEGCRHGRVFRLPIDPIGTTFHYRARGSINSFFHINKKRNYKKDEVLYHSAGEVEHIIGQDIWRETHRKHNMPHTEITYIDVDSIWDFYTLIGYDYKKKKYL